MPSTIAEKMRKVMAARGLAQADLARGLGCHQPKISRWLDGDGEPKLKDLPPLARTLGVAVGWLADPEATGEPELYPESNERERRIFSMVGLLGLDEAERRLLLAPEGSGREKRPEPETEVSRFRPQKRYLLEPRDEAGAAPKPAPKPPKKPRGSGKDPGGHHNPA